MAGAESQPIAGCEVLGRGDAGDERGYRMACGVAGQRRTLRPQIFPCNPRHANQDHSDFLNFFFFAQSILLHFRISYVTNKIRNKNFQFSISNLNSILRHLIKLHAYNFVATEAFIYECDGHVFINFRPYACKISIKM